jgi:hypothetical protein
LYAYNYFLIIHVVHVLLVIQVICILFEFDQCVVKFKNIHAYVYLYLMLTHIKIMFVYLMCSHNSFWTNWTIWAYLSNWKQIFYQSMLNIWTNKYLNVFADCGVLGLLRVLPLPPNLVSNLICSTMLSIFLYHLWIIIHVRLDSKKSSLNLIFDSTLN